MPRTFKAGQTISALGRDWTVVVAPEGDVDLLIADPHARDDERRAQAVFNQAVAKGKSMPPPQMAARRSVLDFEEIAA